MDISVTYNVIVTVEEHSTEQHHVQAMIEKHTEDALWLWVEAERNRGSVVYRIVCLYQTDVDAVIAKLKSTDMEDAHVIS